jgi:hypothetical protein
LLLLCDWQQLLALSLRLLYAPSADRSSTCRAGSASCCCMLLCCSAHEEWALLLHNINLMRLQERQHVVDQVAVVSADHAVTAAAAAVAALAVITAVAAAGGLRVAHIPTDMSQLRLSPPIPPTLTAAVQIPTAPPPHMLPHPRQLLVAVTAAFWCAVAAHLSFRCFLPAGTPQVPLRLSCKTCCC